MIFACFIRIKDTDRYLGDNLKEVDRQNAPMMRKEAAEVRARKRFGSDWQNHVVIEEGTYEEWMSYIARKKKGVLTPALMEHLSKIHEKRWKVRPFKIRYEGRNYIVCARSAYQAAALLSVNDRHAIKASTFRRHAKVTHSIPEELKDRDLSQPVALFKKRKGQWVVVKPSRRYTK